MTAEGSKEVLLLDYGAGNLRSAEKALLRAGLSVRVTNQPAELEGAAGIVVPGQGHFRQVMEAFDASGFREPLLRTVRAGTPLLGICVGMQMLFSGSEEAPGVAGLGLIEGTVKRFENQPGLKVPQMGWNTLEAVGDSPLLRGLDNSGYAYFVHSYYVPLSARVTAGAITEYGVPFWSVISQGNIHATQFHPEKSGELGLALLSRFRRNVIETA
ncbi:imidazole glycerol phosphate synthase subunit HisH [Deinococcus psychrotolerans]|uniref:Imidazole glycerol phosphate synthase subunit HisH n=1 Tax=Deinococcus psychrotolerans TaxID=2489213 RepID=A0A3G8YAV4_9DEIO|nr:imidazole glycerol phosphate synthase subunit HisH [Deinococcus psychrotolerans]AZI42519.1 imidazole glycerol phosphate synthase subunit HisH [Deinococcus psychrotolerans]